MGSEQVAQLMTIDPKDLGNLNKIPIEEGWGCSFQGSDHLGECTSHKFNRREIWKVFEGITADWFSVAFKLKIILLRAECFTKVLN